MGPRVFGSMRNTCSKKNSWHCIKNGKELGVKENRVGAVGLKGTGGRKSGSPVPLLCTVNNNTHINKVFLQCPLLFLLSCQGIFCMFQIRICLYINLLMRNMWQDLGLISRTYFFLREVPLQLPCHYQGSTKVPSGRPGQVDFEVG